MEEYVGQLWHRLITRAAGGYHPEAAVRLEDMNRTLSVFFRALGGDPGLRIAPSAQNRHGARRRWLSRLANTHDRSEPACRTHETLNLPAEIGAFPEPALNRDLYLWLAALGACDPGDALPWLARNQSATCAALARYPGLRSRYQRLVDAHLAQRLPEAKLPEAEQAQERVIREALARPDQPVDWPPSRPRMRAPQPVPLWLYASPHAGATPEARRDHEAQHGESGGDARVQQTRRYEAQRTELGENKNGMLMLFRAESLFSWAEYIKVNRLTDDDPDPNAASAAEELDFLSVTQDGERTAARIRFDLDLPAAAEDDTPLGPGLPLPEWDWRKHQLLPDYVRLQPMAALDVEPCKLPDTLQKTARRLRAQFAALAPARRWLKGQPDGGELDVDACVRHFADLKSGTTPEAGTYLNQVRCERDLAVTVLADLSLSTDAWISDTHRVIDVIRDSLLLFSEALSATGDRFALYGFSSLRRNNVRFHLLKEFDGAYDSRCRGRINAIKPGYYTRLGAPIRQCAQVLSEQPAGRRLLLILSDGKPNDLDHYEGRHGIEDTRMAVIEARRQGIQPFCVTIDTEARGYLPHIFGPGGFTVIRKPEELPNELPLLYAQLTRQS